MKKKFSVVFLVTLMIASLFISCDNGIKNSDPLAKVLFVDSESLTRGLNSSSPAFDASKLYWTYEAQKMDNSGLKTGETTQPVAVSNAGNPGLADSVGPFSVGPFSLGTWKFTLQAHEDSTSGNVLYTGVASNVVITDNPEGNKVSIKVHPLQEGNGTVVISDAITLKDEKGNLIADYDEVITFAKASTPNEPEKNLPCVNRAYTVPAGAWKVTIEYLCPENHEIAYGRNSIYVTVFANQTVTIGGTLEEITGETKFETTADGGIKTNDLKKVETNAATELSVNSSPAVQKPAESGVVPTEAKTTVSVPQGVLKGTNATLDVVTYEPSVAANNFVVTSDNAVVGGIDLKLAVDNTAVKEFSEPVTVTTYVAKGLTTELVENNEAAKTAGLEVKYNGGNTHPEIVSYNPDTGELKFKTNHFSQFFVVSNNVVAVDVANNMAYSDLATALTVKGSELHLLKDCDLTRTVWIEQKLSLYLGSHKVNVGNNNLLIIYPTADVYIKGEKGSSIYGKNSGGIIWTWNGCNAVIEDTEIVCDGTYAINAGHNLKNGKPDDTWDGYDIPSKLTVRRSGISSKEGAVAINGGDTTGNFITFEECNIVGGIGYLAGKANTTVRDCNVLNNLGFSVALYQKTGEILLDGCTIETTTSSAANDWCHMGSGYREHTPATIVIEACGYPANQPKVTIKNNVTIKPAEGDYDILVIDWRENNEHNYYRSYTEGIDVPFRYAEITSAPNKLVEINDQNTIAVDTTWYDSKSSNFSIGTPAELAGLSKLVSEGVTFKDKTITLANDIDLSEYTNWKPIGTIYRKGKDKAGGFFERFDGDKAPNTHCVTRPGSKLEIFQGTFNGAGFAVNNLNVNVNDDDKTVAGLFGLVGDGAVIKNITVNGSVFNAKDAAGGIAGMTIGNVEFNNCINNAVINQDPTEAAHVGGSASGGIVGRCYANHNIGDPAIADTCVVKLIDCTNNGVVYGKNGKSGGLIGYIDNYYTVGSVKHSVNVEITTCHNNGDVSNETGWAGGFIGELSNKVTIDGGSIKCNLTGTETGNIIGHQDTKDTSHPTEFIEKSKTTITVPRLANV